MNNTKPPIIIHYDNDDIVNIHYKSHYSFLNKEDSYLTTYEECILVDFINYYLRNTYKDIIFIFNSINTNNDTIKPDFHICLILDDFIKSIVNNQETIKKEYVGALLYNVLFPYLLNNKNLNSNINDIKSISIYSNRLCIMQWNKLWHENIINSNNFGGSYGPKIKERIIKSSLKLNYNIDDYFLIHFSNLPSIFVNELFDIVSNTVLLLMSSKVIILKFNDNNIVYLINRDNNKFVDIDDYIINNKFYEYIIEKEYYDNEKDNSLDKEFNLIFHNVNYLNLYLSLNNNELLKYNNIIKPWAQENIYKYIDDIFIYKYSSIIKPIFFYSDINNTIVYKNYEKLYSNILPDIQKAIIEKYNKSLKKYNTVKNNQSDLLRAYMRAYV